MLGEKAGKIRDVGCVAAETGSGKNEIKSRIAQKATALIADGGGFIMRIAAPLDRCLAEMGDFVFEAFLEHLLAGNFGDELFARQCAIGWVARQRAVGCNGGKGWPDRKSKRLNSSP